MLPKTVIKAAGAVIIALALTSPAQAKEDNLLGMLIKLNDLVRKLQNTDIEYEIDRTIKYNIQQYGEKKRLEKLQKQGHI